MCFDADADGLSAGERNILLFSLLAFTDTPFCSFLLFFFAFTYHERARRWGVYMGWELFCMLLLLPTVARCLYCVSLPSAFSRQGLRIPRRMKMMQKMDKYIRR